MAKNNYGYRHPGGHSVVDTGRPFDDVSEALRHSCPS